MSEVLGSYRQPGRIEPNPDPPRTIVPALFRTSRRRIICSLVFIATIALVLTAVIVAVVLGKSFFDLTIDNRS